jgi:beta-glucosidase-like glycosyl hydrolase
MSIDPGLRRLALGTLLAAFAGGSAPGWAHDLLTEGLAGHTLFGTNVVDPAQLAELTASLRSVRPDALIAIDEEGGDVTRLAHRTGSPYPGNAALGAVDDPGLTRAVYAAIGADLAAAGINLDLAPVADIVPAGTEAANPPIGAYGRQYGATAAQVVPPARAVVDGLSRHGVTAALKHFPGLGRVHGNTDDTASVVDTVTTPGDDQVRAFATLADSPAHPFVMASTAVYSRIDGTQQAAFSGAVLTGLLRHQLGFDGVVISDDLGNATAVAAVPPGERAVRFIAAGGTLVLTVNPDLLPQMVAAVLDRDRTDKAFSAALDTAVRTALVAKARAGLLR